MRMQNMDMCTARSHIHIKKEAICYRFSLIEQFSLIPRTIEQHLENLDQIRSQPNHNISVRGSMAQTNILQREVTFFKKHFCASSHILCSQRILRKREVTLSRINIYIVYIIVSCHTVRIIPNAWEIVHRWDHSLSLKYCELLPQNYEAPVENVLRLSQKYFWASW